MFTLEPPLSGGGLIRICMQSVNIYIYIYISQHIYTYVYMHICICVSIYMYICIYVYMLKAGFLIKGGGYVLARSRSDSTQ